jgi:hypothetical protein
MELKGYDADEMRMALAVIDSISPLNGMVTKYFEDRQMRPLVRAGLLWEDTECGDYFEDNALVEWKRDGDVRVLAKILGLDIEISI